MQAFVGSKFNTFVVLSLLCSTLVRNAIYSLPCSSLAELRLMLRSPTTSLGSWNALFPQLSSQRSPVLTWKSCRSPKNFPASPMQVSWIPQELSAGFTSADTWVLPMASSKHVENLAEAGGLSALLSFGSRKQALTQPRWCKAISC